LRAFLICLGVVAVAAVVLVAGGGFYRTVNAGGGRVYIVNRFTGRSRLLGAPAPRSQASKEADRVVSISEEARARGASLVGDARTHLYHDPEGGYPGLWAHAAPADDSSGLARILRESLLRDEARKGLKGAEWINAVCPALRRNLSPVYFDNAHEALSEGYWPCADCLPTKNEQVVAERATIRAWPDGSAPRGFAFKRGEEVTVIARYGKWAAVSLWYAPTGKRTYGWLRDEQLLWPGTNDVRQWCADAEDAHRLRAAGSTIEAIAAKRHWRQWYVERLLQADPTPD